MPVACCSRHLNSGGEGGIASVNRVWHVAQQMRQADLVIFDRPLQRNSPMASIPFRAAGRSSTSPDPRRYRIGCHGPTNSAAVCSRCRNWTNGAFWDVQARAIRAPEQSFGRADQRALIQMATDSGKTFAAANVAYRVIKYAGASRVETWSTVTPADSPRSAKR
jgi:hypothetical protein